MTKPLTDEEFEGLKKYYESCTEPKPDVFALIATVDQLKDNRRLWVSEANRYMRERDKLKMLTQELENFQRKTRG